MKRKHKALLVIASVVGVAVGSHYLPSKAPQTQVTGCDTTLWQHVYSGDPRKFSKPQDRLKVLQDCITVTGVIKTAKAEADGDYHLRLDVDPQFKNLLNEKNVSGQQGDLVLETICSNPIIQRDTLQEGSCDNFHQDIFTKDMIGKHVSVIGVYVEDQEHGWRELHPVTSITVQ